MVSTYRIYVHYTADTNTPFYVGRAKDSCRPYVTSKRNPYWVRVATKHGKVVKVFGGTWTKEYADKLEQRLIHVYSKRFKLTNLTKGGDGCIGFSHTKRARKAMSDKRKGKPHSKEWCDKISKSHLLRFKNGAVPNSYKYIDVSRKKLSEAGKRKKNKPNSKSKQVICNTTGEVFVSCSHAANTYGANKDNLLKHLQRRKYYNTIKGKVFSWLQN